MEDGEGMKIRQKLEGKKMWEGGEREVRRKGGERK